MGHFFPLKTEMWTWRFPQQCCWRHTSPGMACYSDWKVVPNIVRDCNVFVFWTRATQEQRYISPWTTVLDCWNLNTNTL
jgi:hypothetical protein